MATASGRCDSLLQRFSDQLQCVICAELPRNAHICPHCSALFCHDCVWQWLTRAADEDTEDVESCPHCRKQLRPGRLVKLQWFGARVEPLREALERAVNGDDQAAGSDLNLPQDVEPKPQFTVGTFTLRNFRPQQMPTRIFSQKVVDDLGSIWRLEVFPRGEWISAYLTLNKGLEGRYEYIIETLNNFPKRLRFESNFKQRSSFGAAEFIDTRPIPGDAAPMNINFRYFVRPVSFEEKCKLQQKLLDKLDKQDELLKGNPNTFYYRVENFSDFNKATDRQQESYEDDLLNNWRLELNTGHSPRFLEMKVQLMYGVPGLYEVRLQLTNEVPECNKKLSFQHTFEPGWTAVFNMQIRWGQLDEYGFTHFDADFLEVIATVCPVHLNHQELQELLFSSDDDEGSYESNVISEIASEEGEQYYY
uniref:E3 ubiquitin-protein ligase TRIM37 n=3 Tax=Culex pipiens TaxID=7175 RepID=A0A8D8AT63_CULPI